MANTTSRSFLRICLSQLKLNYKIIKSISPASKRVMIVIKANAYGHGDVEVAKILSKEGVTDFAVATIDEAIHLRENNIQGQILILGYTPLDRAEEIYKYDITQTLISEEYANELIKKNFPIKCHFAIDTGMRRIGLNSDDLDYCESVIRKVYASNLILNGFFTHLCVADTPAEDAFTNRQITIFEELCDRVSDLKLPYCHCLNSAGGLWHKSKYSCFIRLGIVLYGLKPDFLNALPEGIEPVLSWKSVVSMVKDVKPGDSIGYGRTFKVDSPMRIATIPTGYADGYNRLLSNKGWVLVNGRRASIVGRICMDQFMVDVTDIPDVKMGAEVILIGKSGNEVITADDLGHLCGTIGYEIVCGISDRVKRVIIKR